MSYLTSRPVLYSRKDRRVEYTELTVHPFTPGRLTTWHPHVEEATWRPDPRGISWDHANHLAHGRPGSWIGSVMRVPLAYDEQVLRRALRAWIARHEALRTTVAATAEGGWQRLTALGTGVDVRAADQGWHGGEEARDLVSEAFATISPSVWPHVVFASVHDEGADDFLLAFGADHSVMDAYSQLLWFAEIVELLRRVSEGTPDAELVGCELGSHIDHSALDRSRGEALTVDSDAVRRWRDFLAATQGARSSSPGFPHFPDPHVTVTAVSEATPAQRSSSTRVASAEQAGVLAELCRGAGTGLQSGAIAMLALALRPQRGVDRLDFVLPLHTRQDPAHASSVGWYVGCAPVALDLAGSDTLLETIERVAAAVTRDRDLALQPLPRVAELLELDDHPHFVISFVDTRTVPGSVEWTEWEARALRSPVHADDEVYLWLIRDHEGINVSARYPRTGEAEQVMGDLLRELRWLFESLRPAGAQREVTA